MVNRGGEVVAVSDEFNIGSGAASSCAGLAGVPDDVEAIYVGSSSITFRWSRPSCDEQYGPIEGYEYMVRRSGREERGGVGLVCAAGGRGQWAQSAFADAVHPGVRGAAAGGKPVRVQGPLREPRRLLALVHHPRLLHQVRRRWPLRRRHGQYDFSHLPIPHLFHSFHSFSCFLIYRCIRFPVILSRVMGIDGYH